MKIVFRRTIAIVGQECGILHENSDEELSPFIPSGNLIVLPKTCHIELKHTSARR